MADFTRVGIKERWLGASTDTKPISAPPGSEAYEHNTGALFIMAPDMATWTAYAPKKFIADGTVAAPGLAFAADPDTGIYRVGANTIGIAAGGIQAMSIAASVIGLKYGFTETLTPNVTAAGQTVNAVPSATTLTAANAQAFTGTAGHIVLPAITPAANGGGITLTGLSMSQGAIANVADSEAITVKMRTVTGAAGAALATGVYTWISDEITLPNQAANGAANAAIGIKITGGTLAGGASAYQRGVDITMAAATDAAINIGAGTVVLPANTAALKVKNTAGTARTFLTGADDAITLDAYGTLMLRAHNTASYLQLNDSDQAKFILASVARMELTGTGLSILGADAASGAGNVADCIPLYLRASYRDGANALTSWYASILHDMTTGGATPASSVVHAINSVAVLTLTNTNGTPSAVFPGVTTIRTGDSSCSPQGDAILVLERATWTNLHIMTTNNTGGGIYWGDGDVDQTSYIIYRHTTDDLVFNIGTVTQLLWTDGAMAFQKATTISTTAGALTLNPYLGLITKQQTTASPMAVLTTAASANLKNSDDTEKSTVETGYTKIKQVLLNEAMTGTARITFDLKTAGGGATATGRIYKNGVALGTEQTDVTGGYVTKSEDLGPFVAGDLIQVYAKTSDGARAAYVQNLRLSYDVAIVTTALSATNQDP